MLVNAEGKKKITYKLIELKIVDVSISMYSYLKTKILINTIDYVLQLHLTCAKLNKK